jgi:hypothetical protein
MTVPDWYQLLLLSLAAYRTFRLLSEDTILDGVRVRLVGLKGWREGTPTPPGYRLRVAEFVTCAFCLGAWVSLGWWLAFQMWPHGTVVAAVPFAVSAAVVFVASVLSE